MLDPVTLGRLSNTQEKVITFPSGKKIITEFGGYVQTSGKIKIRIHPSAHSSEKLRHRDSYIEYVCEPNNLGEVKPRALRDWADETKELVELPSITTPVEVANNAITLNQLPKPETKFLSSTHLRMLGGVPTNSRGEEWAWINGMVDLEKLSPNYNDIFQEFESYEASKLFFHTETSERYNDPALHRGYGKYSFFGDNPVASIDFAKQSFLLSIHYTANDVLDSSVSPKWGRGKSEYFSVYKDVVGATLGGISKIEVPNLPSHLSLDVDEPNKKLSFSEWQFIDQNTPEAPSRQSNPIRQQTWKDCVPHAEITLAKLKNTLYTSSTLRAYKPLLVVPDDGYLQVRLPAYDGTNHSTYTAFQYNAKLVAGDVYRLDYVFGDNTSGMRWITWRKVMQVERTDGADWISLHGDYYRGKVVTGDSIEYNNGYTFNSEHTSLYPDNSTHPIFNTIYMLNPNEGYQFDINNFIIAKHLSPYPDPAGGGVQQDLDMQGYHLQVSSNFLNNLETIWNSGSNLEALKAGDYVRFDSVTSATWGAYPYHRTDIRWSLDRIGTYGSANYRPAQAGFLSIPELTITSFFDPFLYKRAYTPPLQPKYSVSSLV